MQRITEYSQNITISTSKWIMQTRIFKQFAIRDLDRLLREKQALRPTDLQNRFIHTNTASIENGSSKRM